MPIIMADGLLGDEDVRVRIDCELYRDVNIAAVFQKIQAMVLVSHFTGHIQTGFGAALKNLGMGCAGRKGKMEQHSSIKPQINSESCTICQDCLKWCPVEAIGRKEGRQVIDHDKCFGCGQCLAVCRFDSVKYNWGKGIEQVQRSMVEYAYGVYKLLNDKMLCINFLNKITKDCDCMQNTHEIIAKDIGVLISRDPVAIDACSIDMLAEGIGRDFTAIGYGVEHRYQIDHCLKIGFGNVKYQLIESDS
jgi:uncharacterized Fe-S center protein